MTTCTSCKAQLAAAAGLMTGEGLVCQACYDRAQLESRERLVELELKHTKAANPFGDGTFDPARRKRAMIWTFVVTAALLVTWFLKFHRRFM